MRYVPSIEIRLAKAAEAAALAEMSRQLIEHGLSWTWRSKRVQSMIRNPECAVIVAKTRVELAGFAIMEFHQSHAHLNLLAVADNKRREGIATVLLGWLEESAKVAAIDRIELEVRRNNDGARAFYKVHDYEEVAMVPGYYEGREDGIKMIHYLVPPDVAEKRP